MTSTKMLLLWGLIKGPLHGMTIDWGQPQNDDTSYMATVTHGHWGAEGNNDQPLCNLQVFLRYSPLFVGSFLGNPSSSVCFVQGWFRGRKTGLVALVSFASPHLICQADEWPGHAGGAVG